MSVILNHLHTERKLEQLQSRLHRIMNWMFDVKDELKEELEPAERKELEAELFDFNQQIEALHKKIKEA